ncbi:MAG: hypothetical protein PHE27_01575 [Alphaproteobacteria bacterium]|nr:hypothetical protein [Alphaproteobacteria bacterium]
MAEHNLFQEVQEDLERQKLEALWKKYGPWIVLVALGIVVSTASSSAYRAWRLDRSRKVTAELLVAGQGDMSSVTNTEAYRNFADVHKGESLGSLALLRAGSVALDQNNKAEAIGYFERLASDAKTDPAFRQLGTLLSVQAQLDDGDPETLSRRLDALTADNASWRYSALEAQAYLALRANDKARAEKILTSLSTDRRAPQSLSARAANALRTLN